MTLLYWLKGIDLMLWVGILFLFVFGMTALWGLAYTQTVPQYLFFKQLLLGAVAFTLMMILSLVDYRILRDQSSLVMSLYLAGIAGLGLLLVVAAPLRGAQSWFQIAGFAIEPIEFMKIIILILCAKYFSIRHIELYGLHHIIVSGFYVLVPVVLTMMQPDLGSALVLAVTWFGLITLSGIRFKHFMLLVASSAVACFLLWSFVLSPYQRDRVLSFIQPQADPLGISYNVRQSVIAVGSGQIFGRGLGYGTQSHLRFLPEAETDFIFAMVSEEWGFVGSSLLMALFGFVLWRILYIGFRAGDNFARLFSLGFALLLFIQGSIHIGMNMGLLPVTGLTLPFVSYGGSSLLALAIGVGIIQSIAFHGRSAVGPSGLLQEVLL